MFSYFFTTHLRKHRAGQQRLGAAQYFRRVVMLAKQNRQIDVRSGSRFENFLLHTTSLAGTHFLLSPPVVLEAYSSSLFAGRKMHVPKFFLLLRKIFKMG